MKRFELRIAGKNLLSAGRYCGHWFVWIAGRGSFVVGGQERLIGRLQMVRAIRELRSSVTEGTES